MPPFQVFFSQDIAALKCFKHFVETSGSSDSSIFHRTMESLSPLDSEYCFFVEYQTQSSIFLFTDEDSNYWHAIYRSYSNYMLGFYLCLLAARDKCGRVILTVNEPRDGDLVSCLIRADFKLEYHSRVDRVIAVSNDDRIEKTLEKERQTLLIVEVYRPQRD